MKNLIFKIIKNSLIALIILSELLSCSSFYSKQNSSAFHQKLSEKNCEDALKEVPENDRAFKFASSVEQASGTVLSYTATGAAYTVEVLWDFTAGMGTMIALCAPMIALAIAAQNKDFHGNPTPYCFSGSGVEIQAPPLGRNTFSKTESFRCPNVDSVSQSIRKVAACYEDKGGEENLKKAFQNLEAISKSHRFYTCISNEESSEFQKQLASLRKKLNLPL